MTAGMAAASCMKKAWPPSYNASWAPGIASARNSLLAGGAIPSKRPPQTKVGHAMSPRRPAVSCSARAASWLARPESGPRRPLRGPSAPDQRDHVGVGLPPGLVPSGVEELHPLRRPLLRAQLDELVKRVGSSSRPTGGGAGECEPSHPLGVPDGQLLGHHSPEREPEDQAVLPAHGIEQPGGVVGEVRHGVGPGRHAARPGPRWS